MAELYLGKIPVIRRDLNEGFLRGGAPGETGLVPRDYDIDPVMARDSPDALQLYDEADWRAIYDRQQAEESSLIHRYLSGPGGTPAFEFLDQNGFPDCWTHSTGHGLMMDKVIRGLPVERLNAVAVATLLKQTDGGWAGLSAKFARTDGYPVIGTGPGQWPYQSRKGHDTPELRANMALHKSEEDWYDLGRKEWDQTLSRKQLVTLGFSIHPCPTDWNRFSHSMLYMGAVPIGNVWSPVVLNNWKTWGYYGLGVLFTMWPDNAVCIRSTTT